MNAPRNSSAQSIDIILDVKFQIISFIVSASIILLYLSYFLKISFLLKHNKTMLRFLTQKTFVSFKQTKCQQNGLPSYQTDELETIN